ncbi:NUDIX domain-containing protein [Enteractinococcus coprophilus]|uniref:NUDIX domain-containing protein n=1 Tax=Enteractinococcus coprophilus TaxID=1027633 RepID=A0A543ANT3_9MICC|nr:NUDIX domain-containing protein [Enteractinococcus coprophilus]
MSQRPRGAADRTPPNVWGTSASARHRVRRDPQSGQLLSDPLDVGGQVPTVREISAGGMVVREHRGIHQVAIIARYNRGGRLEWVLPKGHPEGEEDHHEAAMREVAEETGISGDILTHLGHIEYTFTVPGRRIHKTVHHFLLRATGGELTIENDPDQEAVDVAWVDVDRLTGRLTFVNERRIVELARELMAEFFDISPPPATIRPRRVVPMTRRLPSGLIPVQFRTDDESVRKPPTPYELAQKLARAPQLVQQAQQLEPQPEAQCETHDSDHGTERLALESNESAAPSESQDSADNLPQDSASDPVSEPDERPKIPKPSAALFKKRQTPNT